MVDMGFRVTVERTGDDDYVAHNGKGASLAFGASSERLFSPVEMLLAALGGCNIVTVEPLTSQRGHRLTKLVIVVEAEKIKVNQLGPITATYEVVLPADDPDAAQVFRDVAERVHERHCTVSTALREPTAVEVRLP
jgi:putative redox protein